MSCIKISSPCQECILENDLFSSVFFSPVFCRSAGCGSAGPRWGLVGLGRSGWFNLGLIFPFLGVTSGRLTLWWGVPLSLPSLTMHRMRCPSLGMRVPLQLELIKPSRELCRRLHIMDNVNSSYFAFLFQSTMQKKTYIIFGVLVSLWLDAIAW